MNRTSRTVLDFARDPAPAPRDVVIATTCDGGHFHYARTLVRSLDAVSPPVRFDLHLVNPDAALLDTARALAAMLENVDLRLSAETSDLSALPADDRRAYYASARFLRARDLFREQDDDLLLLDSDSIFIRPPDRDFTGKPDPDVCILRRDGPAKTVDPRMAVANGAVFLARNAATGTMLERLGRAVEDRVDAGALPWFSDQELVYRHLTEARPRLRVFGIREKYVDWQFRSASVIWSAKGSRKDEDPRYRLARLCLSPDAADRDHAARLMEMLGRAFDAPPAWMAILERYLDHAGRGQAVASAADLAPVPPAPAPRAGRAGRAGARIAIFLPRLDLPWGTRHLGRAVPPLSGDKLDLRLPWKAFTARLANAFETGGLSTRVIEIPNAEITPERVDEEGAEIALVPHRCHLDFQPGATPVLYYMQEYFRWCFVVDPRGWSAASSCYPFAAAVPRAGAPASFARYRADLLAGRLGTKFGQQAGAAPVPGGAGYVFFPLQVPHDQSIAYFSDLSQDEVVAAVAAWARRAGIRLVLKPHPANMKSTRPYARHVDGETVFWSEAHVHDLIADAAAVYTLNSGVGFEALLRLKPVVTFARVDYDAVTIPGRLDRLDAAWEACRAARPETLAAAYGAFFDWFMDAYAYDMSDEAGVTRRAQALAAEIGTRLGRAPDAAATVRPPEARRGDVLRRFAARLRPRANSRR